MARELTDDDRREYKLLMRRYELGLPNAHTGPFEKSKQCAKYQVMCSDCGEFAAKISWKDDVRNSNTWFFATCDVCDGEFCEDCIDESYQDERTTGLRYQEVTKFIVEYPGTGDGRENTQSIGAPL